MANIYLQQKAENTLKRADDLIETGQIKVAFQELQAVISSSRTSKNRQWSETLEEVMMKFVEISVELRKGIEVKNAVLQFRTICMPDHTQSLDRILKHFVELSEGRAAEAQAQSNSESLTLQKDLEDEVPENILLSEVSGEDLKDRKDREIVTPWLKFLWEAYRIVLDILKTYPNKELQARYHDTAQRAFKFCKDYKRKTEFRRLSEMLRLHLSNIQKYASQKDSTHAKINLGNSETLQSYLDTRFKQLDVASDLELWTDAYKSIEDIHSLIRISKKAVDSGLMMKYYEHLSKIFWVSENYVLHSFAYYKLFNLKNSMRQKDEDIQLLASTLLLSTLSIPSKSNDADIINVDFVEREKQQRMALLLGLSVAPSKELLVGEILKKQVMSFVYPELRNLYQILEIDFHPLTLCDKMSTTFKFLQSQPQLAMYVKPLQNITLTRLLFQMSKVYEVVKFSEIVRLAPFVTLPEIERAIVLSVQQRRLQITVDHQNGVLLFGKSVSPFDSENLRLELTKLANKLYQARQLINPQLLKDQQASQEKFVTSVLAKTEDEHKALLQRKQFIEKKKIYLDNLRREEEEAREQKLKELAKQKELAEKQYQEKLLQKREEEIRKKKEEDEKKEKQAKLIKELEQAGVVTEQTITALAQKTGKKKSKLDIEKDVDVETIMEVKREELEKEKREKEKRLTDEAKNFDYLERARRLEEIPLLKKRYEQQKQEDREVYERMSVETQEKFQRELTEMKTMKAELEKMFEDKRYFVENFVMKKRREVYEKAMEQYNKKKEEARQKWQARRDRIKKEVDRVEEEKREKQRQRDEEERQRQEEEEKRRREREAERERLRKVSELQAQKEREIEERLRAQREAATKNLPPKEEKKPSTMGGRWTLDGDRQDSGRTTFSRRRFDDDDQGPPRRNFGDDQGPPRRFGGGDQGPPRRRFDDDQGPPRRNFGDDQGPPRRNFGEDQRDSRGAPPKRRFDDDSSSSSSSTGGGRWRDSQSSGGSRWR